MNLHPPKRWEYQNPDIDLSLTLAAGLGITPLVARLMVNRGITTVEQGRTFLYPSYTDLHSPFKMVDMEKAVERIQQSIKKGEQIYIYGDYDADGTTSTALLMNAFRFMDYPVKYYIPHRFNEGYGLNENAVQEIHENGCSLLITVDCGITSVNEVKLANGLGIDVILTDHHQPPIDNPPDAYAIISPKVPGNEYPYKDLAGVGLAFKLAQGLIEDESYLTSLLDLVALGTVVDVAPITGENRTLSRLGLEEIRKQERIGIQKLCEVAGVSGKPMGGNSLSFWLGPRLNAAGRMDSACTVVELLTTDDPNKAEEYANKLDSCNVKRKEIENEINNKAVEKLERDGDLNRSKGLVVAGDDWGDHAKGVVGIVASRLLEKYYRPVFVLVVDGDEATGSGRCIEGMNLADSLNSCSNLLKKHGGHQAAAGVTLKTSNIPKFKHAFNEYACENLTEENLIPRLSLDFETNLSSLTLHTLEQFEILEPFGEKNPSPHFVCKGLRVARPASLMGTEKQHFSMEVSDGSNNNRTIGWRRAQHVTTLNRPNISLDLAFYPEINDYREKRSVQLILEEFSVQERTPKLLIFPPTESPSSGRVFDCRTKDKKEYLLGLLNDTKPCIIYVQTADMANILLNMLIPEKSSEIGIHARTSTKAEEIELLQKLNNGELVAIVSSTFISKAALDVVPIVEHIVFCHLVAQPKTFFMRCKPLVTQQNTTTLHLLYNNESDKRMLQEWLHWNCPDKDMLKKLYKKIREIANTNYIDLDSLMDSLEIDSREGMETGLTIFEELSLVECNSDSGQKRVKLLSGEKRNLQESKTYLKSDWIKQTSEEFQKFQFDESLQNIWERIKNECGISNTSDSDA